jgi:hypothetical protein
MKEEDKASTSFITPFGTYCFIRMLEGLKNVEIREMLTVGRNLDRNGQTFTYLPPLL